jgi:hypothetical protein
MPRQLPVLDNHLADIGLIHTRSDGVAFAWLARSTGAA